MLIAGEHHVFESRDATKQNQIDPVVELRSRVEKILVLEAGKPRLIRMDLFPCVFEIAVDENLVGSKAWVWVRTIVGRGIEIAGEDDRQNRVARAMQKLPRICLLDPLDLREDRAIKRYGIKMHGHSGCPWIVASREAQPCGIVIGPMAVGMVKRSLN